MPEQVTALEDPLHVNEVFASEVVGVGVIHGNVTITFANVRFHESSDGRAGKPRRIVVSRLVLTRPAANQLIENLQKLALDVSSFKADTRQKN